MAKVTLEQITKAVNRLIEYDESVKAAMVKLKEEKEKSRVLREETIPAAMAEIGLKELVLKETGQKITIVQEVYCNISNDNKPQALKWLEENGHGAIIKTEVKTLFGKGQRDDAVDFLESIRNADMESSINETVHSQTLKAFLKEQISSGTKVPLDLFGARPVDVVKIK